MEQHEEERCGESCGSCQGAEAEAEELSSAVRARMKNVRHKIAVMSGKGGVGKTTVSVTLARCLAERGHRVGLLDADVTAPNVAKMLGLESPELFATPAGLFPPEVDGIRVISMAFLADEDSAIIWRGPVIMGVIEQFLSQVVWGELDYLIIDLPPGTGDEALSIMQLLPDLSGVITVTTPQGVALLDTKRSLDMARTMKVPVLGLVVNMASFVCPRCGEAVHMFPGGDPQELARELGVELLAAVPFEPEIARAGDEGKAVKQGRAWEALESVVNRVEAALSGKN